MKIDELVELPWTWEGPNHIREGGNETFEYRVKELPDFFVLGESPQEARREAVPALRAFLQSYLENGEVPPVPANATSWRFTVPWRIAGSEASQAYASRDLIPIPAE